jgi:hypothetical protein
MTFWTTLWYAGAVVFSMGYEGQTEGECKQLGQLIMSDIATSYADPDTKSKIIELQVFESNQFSVSCETEMLPTDEKYTK